MVTSFVLILPANVKPPELPWTVELTPENPSVARWCRLSNDVHGDGLFFDGEIYGLVTERNAAGVIAAFRAMELDGEDEGTLVVKHEGARRAQRIYTYSIGGSEAVRTMRAFARARGVS